MKFHQLPVGTRFRLDGDWYLKCTPLVATRETDRQDRLIRRSARVETTPVAGTEPPAERTSPPFMAALEAYHRTCSDCLERARGHLPAPLLADLTARRDIAWSELLQRLER